VVAGGWDIRESRAINAAQSTTRRAARHGDAGRCRTVDFACADGLRPVIFRRAAGCCQDLVGELAAGAGAVLLCGRYEGLDERVIEERNLLEVSLGDFVLSGGEPAAIALIDAVVRLLPGVMGAAETLAEESFEAGLLEYPHYTRPAEWKGRKVPEILLSGHHDRIRAWRRLEAERATRERRPDLWLQHEKNMARERRNGTAKKG
jgi:tRNA (guanine37-N1)-methyltransferase